ncbi:MAG: multicopper oxidase domain-containing protein [Eubacteriales bacterium]|nr:multicopper oxidase domain-containing protein [Eubacteriales bacterium]
MGSTGNALQLPPVQPDENPAPGEATFTLTAQAGFTQFWADQATATLGYNGSYLGPILRFRQGEKVRIQVHNELGEPTTVHWHGLVVPGDQDGGPHQIIQPGASWAPEFTGSQPAATLWFHPHAIATTATQVYAGLAGLIYIDDPVSHNLGLPQDYGVNDFPLIVQDRNFDSNGQFAYQATMMGLVPGETILVNGTLDPYLDVPKDKVRFRILNASNSENYKFQLSDGSDLIQIASDGGLLSEPIPLKSIALSPGERAEVVIDFSAISDESIQLHSGGRPILDLHIKKPSQKRQPPLPEQLATIDPFPTDPDQTTRVFELQSMGITGTINGKSFDMHRIDETVPLGETETWIIRNRGGMMMQSGGHPFHVHGTQFQVIARNGQLPPAEERGYKDTVFVGEGEEVHIRIRFNQPGLYMYHCHILEHEENGMMGQVKVE